MWYLFKWTKWYSPLSRGLWKLTTTSVVLVENFNRSPTNHEYCRRENVSNRAKQFDVINRDWCKKCCNEFLPAGVQEAKIRLNNRKMRIWELTNLRLSMVYILQIYRRHRFVCSLCAKKINKEVSSLIVITFKYFMATNKGYRRVIYVVIV